MKTRQGFVSNSSSSSFIVAFDEKPKTVGQTLDVVFGDQETVCAYGEGISTSAAAREIFKNLKEQKRSMSLKQIADKIASGWFEGRPEYDYGGPSFQEDPDGWRKKFNDHHKECDKVAMEIAKRFVAQNKGKKFYHFEYSDNDGDFYSTMEHGDTFDRMPHIRVSHH